MRTQPPAPGPLARFVSAIRTTSRHPDGPYLRLPDGEVELIVRITATGGEVHTIGTRRQALVKIVEGHPDALAVRFQAGGAYPFFGVPMSELTDRVVPIEALWGDDGRRLRARLFEASNDARAAILEEALTARLRRADVYEPSSAGVVRRAVRSMRASRGSPRVEALAAELGLSARQLRRAFDDVVGVGPKAFARIVRFQRAMQAAEATSTPDWGAIATQAGYYDQAHLIAEFRAFAGTTPGALARSGALVRSRVAPGESVPGVSSAIARRPASVVRPVDAVQSPR